MREYSKIKTTFWNGKTMRQFRGDPQTQVIAAYLLSNHHANMLGVFYLPITYICNDTGSPLEGASKGLRRVIQAELCVYDYDSDWIWVNNYALNQIGEYLKPTDKRVKGIAKDWLSLPNLPFLKDFYEKYKSHYHLPERSELASPFEAPSKPLRSQEQEQEQEQEVNVPSDDGTPCNPNDSEYPEDFERLWNIKPYRSGSNNKRSAWKAWRARIRSGVSPDDIYAGLQRYAEYCESEGILHTPAVKMMATFCGPNEHWLDDYKPSKKRREPGWKVFKEVCGDDLVSLAEELGLSPPGNIPSYEAYRQKLISEYDARSQQ